MARFLDIAARVSAVIALSGCWGEIGDPGNTSGPCGDIPEPALKRLSHTEYRNTVRDLFPMVTIPNLALAPDPTPHGFDNDSEALYAAPLLINQYNAAASTIAVEVRKKKAMVLPCMASAGAACGHQYLEDLLARAFRRPVTGDELATFTTMFDGYLAANNFDVALELTTQAILQAPQFLYRVETGTAENLSSSYDVANRLSYFLWATMPDKDLFDAAAANALGSEADVAAQVDRMLADPRALSGFQNFTKQWLEDARLDRVTKPSAAYRALLDLYATQTSAPGTVNRIPNVARFTGRLGFDWQHPLSDALTLRLNGWGRYIGKSRLGIGPVLGEAQGNYADSALTLRVGTAATGVSLGVTNLSDSVGNRFALGTPFTIGRDQITPLRPRTVRLGFDAAF